ncbi:MAG: recombination protein NinG [Victivallales bacterium]|jgi:hypothetical protein
MNVTWSCEICKRTEKTSPHVLSLAHSHGGQNYPLARFKKERRAPGTVTIKSLKKEVWDLFSEWVRRSDANSAGYCKCVTCRKTLHWKNMQAGHYIHGTLFLIPELVHAQCPECNGFKAGMAVEYKEFMLKKYGPALLDKFKFLAKRRHKFTIFELQQYKKLYQEKLKEMA